MEALIITFPFTAKNADNGVTVKNSSATSNYFEVSDRLKTATNDGNLDCK